MACGGGNIDPLRLQPGIVGSHLLAACEVGGEGRKESRRRDAGLGKTLCTLEKTTPVEAAMHIGIKEDQEFLVKIMSSQARGHGRCG